MKKQEPLPPLFTPSFEERLDGIIDSFKTMHEFQNRDFGILLIQIRAGLIAMALGPLMILIMNESVNPRGTVENEPQGNAVVEPSNTAKAIASQANQCAVIAMRALQYGAERQGR